MRYQSPDHESAFAWSLFQYPRNSVLPFARISPSSGSMRSVMPGIGVPTVPMCALCGGLTLSTPDDSVRP